MAQELQLKIGKNATFPQGKSIIADNYRRFILILRISFYVLGKNIPHLKNLSKKVPRNTPILAWYDSCIIPDVYLLSI